MHTDPMDVHGQDLIKIMEHLGLTNGQVMISKEKIPPEHLSMLYNMADCTINVADAEGFGLATFESLACGTPIIVNMTGGLQEQVTDGENWFGIGLEPASKAIIGSQDVPYIYEDRVSGDEFVEALIKFTNLSEKERSELGEAGRQHVLKNYSMDKFAKQWDQVLTEVVKTMGSWENRKNYKSWEVGEVS